MIRLTRHYTTRHINTVLMRDSPLQAEAKLNCTKVVTKLTLDTQL